MTTGNMPDEAKKSSDDIEKLLSKAKDHLIQGRIRKGRKCKRGSQRTPSICRQSPYIYTIGKSEHESVAILGISKRQREAKVIGDNFLKSLSNEGHYCIAHVVYIRRRERSIGYRIVTNNEY